MDRRHREQLSQARAAAALFIFESEADSEIIETGRRILDSIRQEAEASGFSDADAIRSVLAPVLKRARGCKCQTCYSRRREEENRVIRRVTAQG